MYKEQKRFFELGTSKARTDSRIEIMDKERGPRAEGIETSVKQN